MCQITLIKSVPADALHEDSFVGLLLSELGIVPFDDTELTGNYTESMVGANAVGAFALADSNNIEYRAFAHQYIQYLWDVQPPTGKWHY